MIKNVKAWVAACCCALLMLFHIPQVSGALERSADSDLDQQVMSGENIQSQQVVIDRGHVDIGMRFIDGQWRIMARDDSAETPTWYDLDKVVIRVSDSSLMDAPTDEAYSFLQAKEGDQLYVIPQTQKADVVWLGWNTQDPAVVERIERGVTMSLTPVSGPGKSWLFLQNGTFGQPQVLMNGQQDTAQDIWVDVNTHVHANWVFSDPGVYLTAVSFRGTTRDGEQVSQVAALRFAVGDQVSSDEAFAATLPASTLQDQTSSTESDTASVDTPAAGTEETEDQSPVPWSMYLGSAVAVLIVAGAGAAWWLRRSTARDEQLAREEIAAGLTPGQVSDDDR